MQPSDFPANCLRPAFTQKVIGWLERGKSVNIFGEEGQGIQRLTEDIAKGCPPAIKLVRLSMRSYAGSYTGFLQALADALGLEKPENADIRLLLNNFLTARTQKIWLCLEHFDRLASKSVDGKNVDTKGYDIHFLNYLNSLSNKSNVSLLVCSQRIIEAQELRIGDEIVRGSRLEFSEKQPLSQLTFSEIEAYLARRMPDSAQKKVLFQKKQKIPFYTMLITEIDNHPESVGFAEWVAGQQIDPALKLDEFQERLAHWKTSYQKHHAHTIDRKLGGLEDDSRRWLQRADRMLGISKIWRNTSLKMKIALGIVISIILGGWKLVAQGWTFLSSFFHQ